MRHSARALAEHLEAHPAVASVSYPCLASHPQHDLAKRQMTSGGARSSRSSWPAGSRRPGASASRPRSARLALSLGGPETLVTHPATIVAATSPRPSGPSWGITDGLVRISVGLEDPDDLVADLDRALAAAEG